jgi:hypothetical protein
VYGVRPNEGSFINNIDFNVTITNDMATMITIGAQASSNSNQPGINSTAFSKFNEGLTDRINLYKNTYPDNITEDINTEREERIELLKKFNNIVNDVYNKDKILNDENVAIFEPINIDFSKQKIGFATLEGKIPAPFFLPFELNLTMVGLSGMKIFEKFALTEGSEKILPSYYRDNNGESLIDFIIFDMKHSIKNNKWETMIKGKSIPSESSLEPTSVEVTPSLNNTKNIIENILNPNKTLTESPDLCPKTAYPELGFINPRPPSTLLSFKDTKNYLTSKYSENLSKSIFAILYAEASKRNNNFNSAGGYNYAGVQTDNARWGAPGIVGQYCRVDSGGVPRAFAVFENDNSFLDFMANRIQKKGFNSDNADSWVTTYINSWWSPANKSAYTKGTPKYNSKLAIYKSAINKYNSIV